MAFITDSMDLDKKDSGVWTTYEGSEFLIASSSNPKYAKALVANQRPFKKQIEKGTIDPDDASNLLAKSIAQGLLLDWRGVQNSAGEDVPYTLEAAVGVLKAVPSFREFVMEFAQDEDAYKREQVKETTKK